MIKLTNFLVNLCKIVVSTVILCVVGKAIYEKIETKLNTKTKET